jgi:hypothetical protein
MLILYLISKLLFLQVDDILETEAQEQRALKVSAYTKLGLTEDEINAIIGAQ